MKYVYFVSYAHGSGFGNGEIALFKEINSYEDIETMNQLIVDKEGFNPFTIVLNYQLLRTEDE